MPDSDNSDPCGPDRRRWISALQAIALVLVLLVLRLPLLDHPQPVDGDEVRFTSALDFPAPYPVQPPGYPLWVGMGTVLHALGLGPYAAYQAWSVFSSCAAPLLLYVGLRWVTGNVSAWWLALGLGVNPLLWFHATTALSYLTGGTLGLLVVGLCYRALTMQRKGIMLWAACVLVVGMFLRADLLIYVGPVFVYAAWHFRRRGGMTAVVIVAAGFALFMAVSAVLYGRAEAPDVQPRLGYTTSVILGTSVFKLGLVDGLLRNLVKITLNLGWDFGVAVLLLPPAIWYVVRHRAHWRSHVTMILMLWAVPGLVFLALMHVVQGYFMLLLPAGYCVLGLALQHRFGPRRAARVAAVLALCSAAQFLCYPWSPETSGFKRTLDAKIAFQSASGLRQIDRRLDIHRPGDFWNTAAHDP